jgi:hypothetical protein
VICTEVYLWVHGLGFTRADPRIETPEVRLMSEVNSGSWPLPF